MGPNRDLESGMPPGLTKMIFLRFRKAVFNRVSIKLSPVIDAPTTTILVFIVIYGKLAIILVVIR